MYHSFDDPWASGHEDLMTGVERLKKGGVIAGKYRLRRRLASGGMGAVWLGRHLALDIPIAIKFVDPELLARGEARWKTRFAVEAKAAASLRHPQVVQVFDHGIDNGTPFIVMELLEGVDLGRHLARSGPLPIAEVAALTIEIARPLGRAHELGIVHRDLKPGNVFLAKSGDETVVKILDFGVAKISTEAPAGEATGPNDLLGSPTYMSPEQAVGAHDVDHRADLWALGVIIYRCLTGALPFQGTVGRVLVDVCTKPPPPVHDYVSGLPSELDAFFERAFAQDPTGRFQSARVLAEEFAALAGVTVPKSSLPITQRKGVAGDEPSIAGTETLAATLSEPRIARRKRPHLWWALAALVVSAIAIGVVASSEPPRTEEAVSADIPTVDPVETTEAYAPSAPAAEASSAPAAEASSAPAARRRPPVPRATASAAPKSERPISEFGY